jgi:hypothetical protein
MSARRQVLVPVTLFLLGVAAAFLAAIGGAAPARADQISCVADGKGNDSCEITFPNVLAAKTTYPDLVFKAGDTVAISASGCVQTGGSGATWKRYVDPEGANSDHLYHGQISIAGATNGLMRLSSVVGKTLPAASGGALTLGYEDDGYTDNGYYLHDDGNNGQCKDQSGPTMGRAAIHIDIHHHAAPFLPAGSRYGMCHATGGATRVCHIDRPDPTHASETFSAITFQPGDNVVVTARGCVQTGGVGFTWKRYVDPAGPNSDHLYHGLISIPGTTSGPVRLSTVAGTPQPVFTAGTLSLGYEDDNLSDNGYWSHDDGTGGQCKNIGAASLDITITEQGPHVSLDGMEAIQAIQDIGDTVTLVAGKQTWVRAYLTGVLNADTVTGVLTVKRNGAVVATVAPQANLTLASGPSPLRPRRESWSGSLNFKLPAAAIASGAETLELAVKDVASGHTLTCNACTRTVSFVTSPPLRLRIFGLTYSSGSPAASHSPTSTDFSLLTSWVGRAYPVPTVQATTVVTDATDPWPFLCGDANAQLSAIRGHDVSNGVDSRTHYLALVSNAAGFMRGCASGVPSSPDPSTVASAPTGSPTGPNHPVNATGDTDASFGDWYGGHELGHTFGRAHPGFCNGNSHDDSSFPYPNGQISDNAGDDTGLDVGATVPALPIVVLPGAARFDIMTYCNQPQWLSAYTYEAVRARLVAENGGSGGAGGPGAASAGPGAAAPAQRVAQPQAGSFVHVVATVDLTAQTARIRYVNPAKAALPDIASGQRAQIRLLNAQGQPIQTMSVALREDTDIPDGEHKTALIDAFIPSSSGASRLQILLGDQVKAEFVVPAGVPAAPAAVTIAPRADAAPANDVDRRFALRWAKPAGAGAVTYTVESSSDGKTWFTIGIGLKDPALTVSEAQARSPFIRVIATDGFRESAPTMIRGVGAAPATR